MPDTTVANVTPRGVVNFCRSRGIASEDLLAAAGISAMLVSLPGSRLSAEQAFALWDEAERATGRAPNCGTRHQHPSVWNIPDRGLPPAHGQATRRDSLQKFIRSFPARQWRIRIAFVRLANRSPSGTHEPICARRPVSLLCRIHLFHGTRATAFGRRCGLESGGSLFAHPAPPGMESSIRCFTARCDSTNP